VNASRVPSSSNKKKWYVFGFQMLSHSNSPYIEI